MHGGVKSTLTELRARFWIIQGRHLVRKLLYKCMICRKLEGRPYQATKPPPLPEFWGKECPPFPYTVADFAGPLYVKNHSGPQQKVWICLYTCCVTRAINLDLVPNLTASAFLRSLRRFPAHRSTPLVWWCLIMGKPSSQQCEKSWNWWTTREWNNTLPMHGWSGRLTWKGPLVGWHIQKTCKIC